MKFSATKLLTTKVSMIASLIIAITSAATISQAADGADGTPELSGSKSAINQSYTGQPANDGSTPQQPGGEREFKNISFSFPIKDNQQLDFSAKQAHTQSRQFTINASGAQLKRGVSFNTSAKGALVRISAFDGQSAVEPKNLSLKTAKGKMFAKGQGFDTLVSSSAMQKSGAGFQEGTTGFKIADNAGTGQMTLKAESGIRSSGRYRINVFEKNSDTALHLTANKNSYLASDTLKVDASVFNQGHTQNIQSIQAKLVSPTGKEFPVSFEQSKDGYQLNKPLNMSAHSVPGALWELRTVTQVKVNGQLIQRNGQVPFAFAEQTAKLSASATMFGQKQSPKATVPINVKTDGRYEVRGVLYGTDASGNLKPAMMTHSAANLAAGEGAIILDFDSSILQKSGLRAPFEVRNIELRDQSQMALVDR